MARQVFLIASLFFAHWAQATPMKAFIVNAANEVVGTKQIRDLALCGQSLGPATIIEGPADEDQTETLTSKHSDELFIDCSDRFDLPTTDNLEASPQTETRSLVSQGPSENRIDLTIVGDGYTLDEKERFFQDAQEITDDLFGDSTFQTYLPLFNVHAVFVASEESGIGDGRPKNTALKLYRHPRSRQAVLPGDERAALKALRQAPDTDYPILVGNDPHYGGLGGQFAITTNAPLNITTVLRHELGHNFGRVGEEYDGGYVYRGANHSPSHRPHWSYWAHREEREVIAHRAKLLHYSAPWHPLKTSSWQREIEVVGEGQTLWVNFSSLGFDTAEDVEIFVDGVKQSFTGQFNYDRNFYNIYLDIEPGRHQIRFSEKVADGNNILSKVAIYQLPENYPHRSSSINAFATYNNRQNLVGYRPTHTSCLMRDMRSKSFCSVCTENMWKNFLREVSLIDELSFSDGEVHAKLIPLGDRLRLKWFDPSGKRVEELTGKSRWNFGERSAGHWTLQVEFVSDEVIQPGHQDWSIHRKTVELR